MRKRIQWTIVLLLVGLSAPRCSIIVKFEDPPTDRCNNGVLDPGEECDGDNLDGQTCVKQGFPGGVLKCTATCELDTEHCGEPGNCGNGTLEGYEECDDQNLDGKSCADFEYTGGTLYCDGDCLIDTSHCSDETLNCGDEYCAMGAGEDSLTCPGDCDAVCGNGVCEFGRGEDLVACPDDCAWVDVSAGMEFTCGVRASGKAYCWGSNDTLKLGNGTGEDQALPTQIAMLSYVTQISAGQNHACAVVSTGGLACWGANNLGQLGRGNLEAASTPGPALLTDVERVFAGSDTTCALKTDGTLWCWGANTAGQLGINPGSSPELCNGTPCSTVPVQIETLDSMVRDMAVTKVTNDAEVHSCALGDVTYCWGRSDHFQTGHGTSADDATPLMVAGLDGPPGGGHAKLAVGMAFTCISRDYDVLCWGDNLYGQLGNGTTSSTATATPVAATGPTDGINALAAGKHHICAASWGQNLWCWGLNELGQLGDATQDNRSVPTVIDITGLTVSLLTAGDSHTCGLFHNYGTGAIYCWGDNYAGQLGVVNGTGINVPTMITEPYPVTGW